MTLRPRAFLAIAPNAAAGALCAVVTLAYAGGFATLIFDGALAKSAGVALVATIVSSCVAMLALSWRSSFGFSLGGPDSNPSAILAVTVSTISAEIAARHGVGAREILPTVLMFLFASTTLCGLCLYIVGKRGWGRYVRYIPHQVVGGFLLGTGYLLLAGGWRMLTGRSPGQPGWSELAHVPLVAWSSAFVVAAVLIVLTRRIQHFLVVPAAILGGALAFHLVLLWLGISLEAARDLGLLLRPLPATVWAHPLNQPWSLVEWDLILGHGFDFVAMTMVVLVTILLNATSLDHVTGQDADFDQELKVLGFANAVAGPLGGIVAVNSFNRSLLNLRAGATSRWAARICAGLVVGTGLLFPGVIILLPKPVLIGLVLYLGLSLLIVWLWDARRKMPRTEYLVMVAILVVVATAGIVPGVFAGLTVSCVAFVVAFSRSSAVKEDFNGLTRRSNVERPSAALEWLAHRGERLQGFQLHGHLFFGTSSSVLDRVRAVLEGADILVLDFWLVRGLDASSVMVLRKLLRLCDERRVQPVFTGIGAALRENMARCGLNLADGRVRTFADLDHGLEWAENLLLSKAGGARSLADVLGGLDATEQVLIEDYFQRVDVASGERLVRSGDPSDAFFIVIFGRVSVHLHMAGGGVRKRLRTYGPGAIVGEMGFYGGEPRSADVCADETSELRRLSREQFELLRRDHPALVDKLNIMVINTLSARLRAANNEIRQLL